MLLRNVAPAYSTDFRISLEPLRSEKLVNGVTVSSLLSETVEVFRLEFIYPYGLLSAPDIQTGQFITRLMALGSINKTALEIAEAFEKLGGFLDISMGYHRTTVTLHGLSQYFETYLPLIFEVIYEASFPESEIELQRNQASQSHLINAKKTAFVANKWFRSAIYGQDSTLGQTLDLNRIESLNKTSLVNFHDLIFNGSTFDVYLCGNYTVANKETLLKQLTEIKVKEKNIISSFPPLLDANNHTIALEETVQSTLVIGKRLFSRNHPDFVKFLVTNTLFGGYFGSRLMKSIREEKGLTYGISSSLVSNGQDGVFSIKADLNKEKLDEALTEIYKEVTDLQNHLVNLNELDTVKNYIKGNIYSSTNTIFDIMDKHKAIKFEHLQKDFYERVGIKIDAVMPENVKEMAELYFNDFSTIIAG